MSEAALVVLSTFGSVDEARTVCRQLVEERLVACANLVPGIESIYRWQDAVETGAETLAIFKTTAAGYERLEARLRELHSYEVPEILALPVADGAAKYLDWLRGSVG